MSKLTFALAVTGALVLTTPAVATIETPEAKSAAAEAAYVARDHMDEVFAGKNLKPGQFVWRSDVQSSAPPRLIVSLGDQMAYLYRGSTLVAVTTISTGTQKNPTPTGIFPILEKKVMHRSRKYDNAPMPHMQRLDSYGIALHAGQNPGYPASHGCIRLPAKFAAKLFTVTKVGSEVMIGA